MAELEEFRAQAAVEEQNLEFVRKVIEEFNKKNIEFFKEVNAPDYSLYYPSGNPNPISHEEMIEMAKMYWEAFPDFSYSIEESMAAGDKVISRVIARGTHKGELQGIPATGKEIEISTINVMRIENGKIAEEWQLDDMLTFMQQLGMELKPKEGE